MTGAAELRAAAFLQAVGLDGMRFLASTDRLETLVMQLLARETAKVLEQRDRAFAQLIGNAVARCFRG